MSKLVQILLYIILILSLSYNVSNAIDENITNNLLANNEITQPSENTVDNLSQTLPNETNEVIDTSIDEETYSTSTIISDASNVSNNSTITNILIIALIVIGFLLILLAIAILIRLGK